MSIPFDAIEKLSDRRRCDLEQAWEALLAYAIERPHSEQELLPRPRIPGSKSLPEHLPRLLILVGEARAGKDYLAGILSEEYAGVRTHAYSTPLVDEVNMALKAYRLQITEANKSLPYHRHLLQAWGLARREQQHDYWLEHLRGLLRCLYQDPETRLVVLTGARARSDLHLAEEYSAAVWRVVRKDNDYQAGHEIEAMAAALPVDHQLMLSTIDRSVARQALTRALDAYRSN